MAEKLLMTALSPTMTEGTIAKWNKAEGEAFSSGDLLCEVETDKASMDYEAPKSAVLLKIVVPAGGKAGVGDLIAVIGKAGEDPSSLVDTVTAPSATTSPTASAAPTAATAPTAAVIPAASAAPIAPASNNAKLVQAVPEPAPAGSASGPAAPAFYPRSSPLARKIAREMNIDIRLVRGSGPEGRVVEKDVRSFATEGPSSSASGIGPASAGPAASASLALAGPSQASPSGKEPSFAAVSGKRAIIAKRLSDSFFSAPHYYLKKEVLVDSLVEARARINAKRKDPISFNAILVKMAAIALSSHPEVNVFWRGDRIERRAVIDIGLAVALPDGLITPVVRDCGAKGLVRIEEELAALIEKAKTKGLTPGEYEGAGFTVTNLGGFGVDEFTAIINPPASAILAVGAILKKAVVRADDSIAAGRTMVLTLGCDHRTVDGAVGALFLAELAAIIEDPLRALL